MTAGLVHHSLEDRSEVSREPALAGERELVRRMLAGDAAARDAFADRFFPPLFRFTRSRLLGDGELARDVVQTTVCKALGNLASYRGEAPLFTWLCACARNEIAMVFRRRGRYTELPVDDRHLEGAAIPLPGIGDGPERAAERKQTAQLVRRALSTLPARYALVLEWKYFDRAPVAEIAVRLAVSEKATESLLTRARVAFRGAYQRITQPGNGQDRR